MNIVRSVFALTAIAAAVGTWAAEPATYRCERLFQAGAHVFDINDRGAVAGSTSVKHEGWYAAIWRQRRMEKLPQVAGFERATNVAYAINRRGDLAGSVNDQGYQLAAVWIDGVGKTLPPFSDAAVPDSQAMAINDGGHAVGYSTNSQYRRHAALWKNGRVIDLGALDSRSGGNHKTDSQANAINASGMVVGHSGSPRSYQTAVQWTDGTRASLVDLGSTAFGVESSAVAVNNLGVVVGWSSIGDSTLPRLPIAWINGAAFALKPFAGAEGTVASDINDGGAVVGYVNTGNLGALVWPHYADEPIDLNTRLDTDGCRGSGGKMHRLAYSIAINNHGEILAAGTSSPGSYAFESFRLRPVSPR
ncbi:DUF3466 family protein [Ideonella sp. DXS29W]|uniref:DUF3466 family protein n=1 Tax=Ideonella lacteola TaxID=2984193 RepID=A0ABU9BLL6_9BURK